MDNISRILHEKAVDRPERISNDATGILVGILDHRKTIENSLPADFSWLMCDNKQSVGEVKKWYGCEKETVNVDLYYGASKVDNATSVSSLDHFHDGIVVFHAVDLDVDTPAVDVWTTPSQAKKSQVTLEVAKSRKHGCVEPMLLGPLAPSLSVQTTLSSLPAARASPLTSTITSHKVNTYSPTFGISSDGVVHREQQTEIQQGTLEWNQWINKMLKTPPGPSEASPMKAIPEIWRLLPNDPIPDHHVETYSGQLSREDLALSLNEIVSEPLIATETPLSDIQSKFSGDLEAECLKDPQADKSPVFVALDGNDLVESPSLFVATPQATPPPAPKPSTSYLRVQKLLAEGSPEDLEAEVRRSLSLLSQLKISVSSHTETGPETQQWSQQMETLKLQNVNEPTIIGVVGNTGAGKSSVINAILDEERLVPTNCMRACTAVVTEMSWNNSDDENEKYRAEIEFIQSTDWEMELRIHFAELLDGNGKISREAGSDADSGASVAYAKIKAVYPHKTKDDILKSSVEQLMQEPAIRDVLGTTRKIHEAKLESFYNSLQQYVDSREKRSDDEKREMALWPLIKVVKIYTKSNALSTGAVIVDLPGIMDSNTARGSVAKSYMKKCTGLWIVAPINRAVDDRAARNLMGDAFKRQLKYDGTYSQVTFICSKTDDISITEASESLGLDDEISPKWNQIDLITKDQRRLEKEIEELRISQAVYYGTLGDANEQLELWEDGKMASASTGISKKRKMASLKNWQRKRRAPIGDSDDDDSSSDTSGDEATPQLSSSESSQSMAVQAVNDKISELKDTKDARMQRRDFTTRLNAVKDELKTLKEKHDEIMAEISTICISARNLYSKTAIQRDFATGIKELDQEVAEEIDEASFNPEEDQRDYNEVARSLPVFCVSSRAYQKLSGRFNRDKAVLGFSAPDQTEIPQLQAHCKKLTEAGRLTTSRRFLNAFSQLVNSMTMWSTNDGSDNSLTDEEMAAESIFLKSKLIQLEGDLQQTVQTCIEEIRESLAENIYNNFKTAVGAAIDEANKTAARWGAPVNRGNTAAGGFYWSTYKAICRRNGVYDDAHNSIDFNDQLSVPMIKRLGSHWETTFVRRLPNIMKSFTKNTKNPLHAFHRSVEARNAKSGVSLAGLDVLGQQLRTYEAIFEDLSIQMQVIINERQRDASREFVPVVARNLLSAYTYCCNERGKGSYKRMKDHMIAHVDSQRVIMFSDAAQTVKGHLKHMCLQVEEHMAKKSEEVCEKIRRDYTQAITGCHNPEGYQLPAWERTIKVKVAKLLDPLEKIEEDTRKENGDEVKEEMDLENLLNDWLHGHADPGHEKIPITSPPPVSPDSNQGESATSSIPPNIAR